MADAANALARNTGGMFQPLARSSAMFARFNLARVNLKTACVAGALVASVAAPTSEAWAVPEAQFQPAFRLFMQAGNGDLSALDKAADAFATLLKAEPANPVLLAYSGAAISMKATTTWLPWKKMGYAEDGLAQLDKALAMLTPAHNAVVQNGTPGQLEVKLVAANTFLAVPGFMNRHERGVKLVKDLLDSPALGSTPAEFREAVNKAAEKAKLAGAAK